LTFDVEFGYASPHYKRVKDYGENGASDQLLVLWKIEIILSVIKP